MLDLENYDENHATYELLLKEEGEEEAEDIVEEQRDDAGEEEGEVNFKVERRYSRERVFLDGNEEDFANYYDEGSTEGPNETANDDDEQSRTETEYVSYSRSNYEEDEAEEHELPEEQRADDPQEEQAEGEEEDPERDDSDPEFKIPKTQIRKRRKSPAKKGGNTRKRRKLIKTEDQVSRNFFNFIESCV